MKPIDEPIASMFISAALSGTRIERNAIINSSTETPTTIRKK